METEKKYFTRKQTVALVVAFFLMNLVGKYYGFPLRFIKFAVSTPTVPAVSEIPQSSVSQVAVEKITANALIGKITSIKVENTGASIVLAMLGQGVGAMPQSVKVTATQDTKITQRILKPKSEIDAINAKYAADLKKDPNTPLPIDALTASIKTLSVTDLKVGDSISVYPLESVVGKTLLEIKEPVAQFISKN